MALRHRRFWQRAQNLCNQPPNLHRHTRTRHYKHLNCNPISSQFFPHIQISNTEVCIPIILRCNMNAREWKQYPRHKKKKKKRRRICLWAAGDSFRLYEGEELERRGQKGTNQTWLLPCGGCVAAVSLAPTQELDSEIYQTSLFLICSRPELFESIYQSSRRHDFHPLFSPILTYLFLPQSLWMMWKSMPSRCSLCPRAKHSVPSCLRKKTSEIEQL